MQTRICTKSMLLLILLTAALRTCMGQVSIDVTNPSAIGRPEELISLTRTTINVRLHAAPEFVAISHGATNLPVQHIDENGDGKWDAVVFLYSFEPGEKTSFLLSAWGSNNTMQAVQRAHVRMRKKNADDSFGPAILSETMPLRNPATDFSKQLLPMYLTEGPGWENDKVAFRLYFDVRNNKDIYGKTTSNMVLDTVGSDPKVSYHKLSDWGMDVLHVVKSLGAGALALSVPRRGTSDTLVRLGGHDITRTVYRQVADGPLLAKFILTYDWKINQEAVRVTEEISIWGGQYFYDSKITVTGAPPGTRIVTGIADFYDNRFAMIKKGRAVVAFSFGKQSENKDNLGLGIMVNKQTFWQTDSIRRDNTDINETYTVAQRLAGKIPLYYRFYAGWERTDKRFRDFNGFSQFLTEEAIKYSEPLRVDWGKR